MTPNEKYEARTRGPRAQMNWPEPHKPEIAPLYAQNELLIAASPATVWAWLIRADLWSSLYENATDVEFVVWPGPTLRAGSVFRWSTFDFRLTSTVHDFEPERRLGWIATGPGVDAYHTWFLEPTDDGGTLLITDETQISTLGIWATDGFTQGLVAQHDLWLQGLAKAAVTGLPKN